MVNESLGWIVGDDGTILYKVGNSWVDYKRITCEDLYSVFMHGKNEGWAVGSKGTILRFDGERWENQPSPTNRKLFSVFFNDSGNGVAVGEHGTVLFYENGIWNLADKPTRGNLYSVSGKGDSFIIGGGMECVNIPVMKILNDVARTQEKLFDPQFEIKSLSLTEEGNIWAASCPGGIFHFDGNEWAKIDFEKKIPALNSICFSDRNTGISVGYSGTVMTYSVEGWKRHDSPVKVKLNGSAVSGGTYYAVGNEGTIISWKDVVITAEMSGQDKPDPIKIEIFPNPAYERLNMIIPGEDGFLADRIIISNVYGQVVLNRRIDPGTGGRFTM
jgi:photosystem II stability/assembly factor-like uncharacterized protein